MIALVGPTAAACAALESRYPGLMHEVRKCVVKAVQNERVNVWRYTWEPGKRTPALSRTGRGRGLPERSSRPEWLT
jgi:hypothetical protein